MEEDELGMDMFQNLDIPGMELNLDDAPEEIKKLLGDNYTEDSDNEDSDDSQDGDENSNEENLNEEGENQPEGVVEEEDTDEGDNQDDNSPNIYSSFADVLIERGLLPSLDLKKTPITDDETLVSAIKMESDNMAKEYLINKLGEEGYQALEKGVTLAEYQNHVNTTNTLDNITDDIITSDLELSKNIILQDYINQGLTEERALKLLKKTIDIGDEAIIDEAKESLVSLKEIQSRQLEKLQLEREKELAKQAEEQDKIDNDLKNAIYSSKEIIQGIKLDKAVQDKIYESITKVVSKSPTGVMENKLMKERRENPIDFDKKLYYLYELTNGFKDFSKLISKSESKAVSKLEQTLRQTNFKGQGDKPTFMDDPNSYGGSQFGSELVL
jgi:hypothetical protein